MVAYHTTYGKELIFSPFKHAHAPAMNEYRGDEMSTEVVVDRNLWTEVKVSFERGYMVDFSVHGPNLRPVLTFFYFSFFFFSFS